MPRAGYFLPMKSLVLIFVHLLGAAALFFGACANPTQQKLKGEWQSKTEGIRLNISGNKFTENTGPSPVTEDYFIKGDTIFTSFEGNLPYTKFVIKQLDDHHLKLLYPDSVLILFMR